MNLAESIRILSQLEWRRPEESVPEDEEKVLVVVPDPLKGWKNAHAISVGQRYLKAWEDEEFNVIEPVLWAHFPDATELAKELHDVLDARQVGSQPGTSAQAE